MKAAFLDNLTYRPTIPLNDRINMSKGKARALFEGQYNRLMSDNNQVNIFGREVKALYNGDGLHTSLEVLPTFRCNRHCSFCISKMQNPTLRQINDSAYANAVGQTIHEFQNNRNLNFDMRVTGGEPLLFKKRLNLILNQMEKNYVEAYRVNSNGELLLDKDYQDMFQYYMHNQPFKLDVSRHHYLDKINDEIFGKKMISSDELAGINDKLGGGMILRSVLINGYIDSAQKIKDYVRFFKEKGFNIFSFRNLSRSVINPEQGNSQYKFLQDKQIDFFELTNEMANNSALGFKFKNQIIKDGTVAELFDYNGSKVKLTYVDGNLLNELESIESRNGQPILRTGIILPDGRFSLGWEDNLKTIKQF